MAELAQRLFGLSPLVRYVAILEGDNLSLNERPGLSGASASETDRYEEWLVNPAVLTLLLRRGMLDCGGLRHVWIRYGNFWTGLFPTPGGHVNVGLEPSAAPMDFETAILDCLSQTGPG